MTPDGLGDAGTALWERLTTVGIEFAPHELLILEEAARTADKLADLRGADADARTTTEVRLQSDHLRKLLAAVDWPSLDEWDGLSSTERARKAAHARWKAVR